MQAKRDENRVPTLLGVSNIDNETPTTIAVNPTTHAMLIDGSSLFTSLDARYLKQVSVPTTPTDSGSPREVAFDSNYLYFVISSNSWKRVAWSAWVVANEYLLMETGDFLLTEGGDKFILE